MYSHQWLNQSPATSAVRGVRRRPPPPPPRYQRTPPPPPVQFYTHGAPPPPPPPPHKPKFTVNNEYEIVNIVRNNDPIINLIDSDNDNNANAPSGPSRPPSSPMDTSQSVLDPVEDSVAFLQNLAEMVAKMEPLGKKTCGDCQPSEYCPVCSNIKEVSIWPCEHGEDPGHYCVECVADKVFGLKEIEINT